MFEFRWDPNSYEGATEIFLSSSDVWIPEFSLYYRLNWYILKETMQLN